MGRCLAITLGSDMTNPRIPGRKWHTVESLRGLESHRIPGGVHPWRRGSYFNKLGIYSEFSVTVPLASLSLTAVLCVRQEINSDELEKTRRRHIMTALWHCSIPLCSVCSFSAVWYGRSLLKNRQGWAGVKTLQTTDWSERIITSMSRDNLNRLAILNSQSTISTAILENWQTAKLR